MFIYCFDEKLAKQLQHEQHKLIKTYKQEGQKVWVFDKKGKFNFAAISPSPKTYIETNKLTF